jgi:hypothetical protein
MRTAEPLGRRGDVDMTSNERNQCEPYLGTGKQNMRFESIV